MHADPEAPRTIAILDSGIDPAHFAFEPSQLVAWRDFVADRPAPYDDRGHGTSVASRAAGVGGAGMPAGGAPGHPLVIAKVIDQDGGNRWPRMARAIRWAVDEGNAAVVSVSVYQPVPQVATSDVLEVRDAVRYATEHGALVVWIAGSYTGLPSELFVGSNSPHALVVGAAYPDGRPVDLGAENPVPQSGADPEVLAWGLHVPVAEPGDRVADRSGSSFAAPYVAGVAARIQAARGDVGLPPLTPVDLERVILVGADDHPAYPYTLEGYGVVNATRSLAIALGQEPPPDRAAADFLNVASNQVRAVATLDPAGELQTLT